MFEQTGRTNDTGLDLLKKIPLVRGVIALLEASASGSRHLQFAADRYDLEPGEESKKTASRLEMILGVAGVGVLSLVIGKMIFTAFPAFLASILFDGLVTNLILQNLIEGAIKTLLLLGYLLVHFPDTAHQTPVSIPRSGT